MGILVMLDEAIAGIAAKKANVRDLHTRWQATTSGMQSLGDHYRRDFRRLQLLSTYNLSLMLVESTTKLPDTEYHKFLANHNLRQQPLPKQPQMAAIYEDLAETAAGVRFVAPAVWKLGSLVKDKVVTLARNAFSDGSEAAVAPEVEAVNLGIDETGDAASQAIINATTRSGVQTRFAITAEDMNVGAGEAGAEAGAEAGTETNVDLAEGAVELGGEAAAGTEAGIAEVGTAMVAATEAAPPLAVVTAAIVVIALGVDAVVSAIEVVSKESNALDRQIRKLKSAIDVLDNYKAALQHRTEKLQTEIVDQQKRFKAGVTALSRISAAKFDFSMTPTVSNLSKFNHAANKATRQYAYLGAIRQNFRNERKNMGARFNWSGFVQQQIDFRPPDMTPAQVRQMITYARQHSADMRAAAQHHS